MAASVVIKQNDTFPPLETQLLQTVEGKQEAVNLFSPTVPSSIKIIMKNGVTRLTGACIAVKAPGDANAGESGHIKYKWPLLKNKPAAGVASTFGVIGKWQIEWFVEWTADEVESFPNEGTDEIEIVAPL